MSRCGKSSGSSRARVVQRSHRQSGARLQCRPLHHVRRSLRAAAWPQLPRRGRSGWPARRRFTRRRLLAHFAICSARSRTISTTTCCCRPSTQKFEVAESNEEVTATFENRRWIFPHGDCRLLPLANTTAELLARYIGLSLLAALDIKLGFVPTQLRVELDECDGQLGIFEWHPS